MGVCLGLILLSDANVERVLRDPPLIWLVVSPDDHELYEKARAEQQGELSLFARLFGRRAAARSARLELPAPEGESTDLDKAWHGIHYLLNATAGEGAPPLNFLVSGGREVGGIEVGYGPARVLTGKETRAVRDALRAVSDDKLRARFNPAEMLAQEVYPEIWDRSTEDDESLEYLIANLQELRGFLDRAVAERLGLVIVFS